MSNSHLNSAKLVKNDEFYTRLVDIQKELDQYDFSNKVVYCPFDSEKSQFVNYFKNHNKPKKLIYTSDDYKKHIDLFNQCDMIVSNPPFSLLSKGLFDFLMNTGKKVYLMVPWQFINVWNFHYFRDGEIRGGKNRVSKFLTPNGEIKSVTCGWITNLPEDRPLIEFQEGVSEGISYKFENGEEIVKVSKLKDVRKGKAIVPATVWQKNYKVKYLDTVHSCNSKDSGVYMRFDSSKIKSVSPKLDRRPFISVLIEAM